MKDNVCLPRCPDLRRDVSHVHPLNEINLVSDASDAPDYDDASPRPRAVDRVNGGWAVKKMSQWVVVRKRWRQENTDVVEEIDSKVSKKGHFIQSLLIPPSRYLI